MTQSFTKVEQETLRNFASNSYRAGDREQAKVYLNMLLKVNPDDAYANRFLGALFLMDENIEAALRYWNRVGEPRIEKISIQPLPAVDAILMDRVFVMAPASPLLRKDLLETEARLQMMGTFKKFEFQLRPRKESHTFDLILHPQVRKGTLGSKMKVAALAAHGALTQTIEPEFHNIRGTTVNSTSLISWDEYRNRFYTSLSFPLGDEPHARLRIFADHRAETWNVSTDLHLRKWETGLEAAKTWNDRMSWTTGAKASYRIYDGGDPDDQSFFHEGVMVGVFGGVDFSLVRIPEKRLNLKSTTSIGTGKFMEGPRPAFVNLEQSLHLTWFPRPSGDDLALNGRLQIGRALGSAPFDEFYSLGADRNMDLQLRAHRSRMDKYGENPFGPGYILFNWDVSKIILENGRLRWRLAPFVDTARITSTPVWKGQEWFLDIGMQSGIQIFDTIELMLTYGKDLRSGRNVVYFGVNL